MKLTKKVNRSLILRELWLLRKTSRVEIAKRLGLDKSTISQAINELIDKDVVVEFEEGAAGPRGGRKPTFISLNAAYGCVLGIEFTYETCIVVAIDMIGSIVYETNISTEKRDRISLTSLIMNVLESCVGTLHKNGLVVLGIGVGIPGVVHKEKQTIRYSAPLGIRSQYDFSKEIASRFLIPVVIENDANACVWGELANHRQNGLKDFIFLLLQARCGCQKTSSQVGFGIGLSMNGHVHYGHQYSAGEFRSLFCSESARGQFSLSDVELAAIFENPLLGERFLAELCSQVAIIVNTLNLSHVFLGGSFEMLGSRVKEIMEREIRKNWPYPYDDDLEESIHFSSFGYQAVAYGVASMMLDTLFGDIELLERRDVSKRILTEGNSLNEYVRIVT